METSAFAFPSDLADEGVEVVLRNIQERAGLGGITAAFAYHAARDVFPHNPRRKVVLLERGRLLYPPDPALYEGLTIRPAVDEAALERDVLAETCRAAAARGLAVNAWTVFLHADRPGEHPGCVTRNAFGDLYPADLCPANPDVRAYVRALVADVARYDVAAIVAESLHFHGLEHGYHHERYFTELGPRGRYLLGLCFCDSCLARAEAAGIDGAGVRARVRGELEQVFADARAVAGAELEREQLADLEPYLEVRAEAVTTLAAEAAETAAAAGKRFVFMDLSGAVKGYATGRPAGGPAADVGWRFGIDLARLARVCPELEVLGYAADPARLALDLEAYGVVLEGRPFSVALRPSPPDCDSQADLAAKVGLVRRLGAARVDFYHYGFVRLEALDWIRGAIES